MQYSLLYSAANAKDADEVRIPAHRSGYATDFIKDHPDKRYLVQGDDATQIEKVVDYIVKVTGKENYTVKCASFSDFNEIKSRGLKGFLAYPVADWETFQTFKSLGVTDIYIDSALCFSHDLVVEAKGDMKIRISPTVSPTVLPSVEFTGVRSLSSFFVRPEDIEKYTGFDIVEFYSDKEDTLFTIYKRGSFNFPINQLVENLESDTLSSLFGADFGIKRMNCGQRCLVPNKHCQFCHVTDALAEPLWRVLKGSLENNQ